MPGIFGIVQSEMRPESAAHVTEDMLVRLKHYPWYQTDEVARRSAGLGLVSLGHAMRAPKCITSADERFVLAFEGELYNAKELQKEMGQAEPNSAEPAHVVLHALRRWGKSALQRCNGIFQLALWDAQQEELLLANDRGGLRPIYYAQQNLKLAFAPEVKALLALPWVARQINYQSVLSFLRHGFCVGPETFFQDVHVLPPGSYAVFRQGRLEIERYWRMNFQQSGALSEKQLQQRFLAAWTEVMNDQTADCEQIGLPLSGGVDSRLILSAFSAQKKKAITFTIGQPGCRDAEIAQRLAETAGYTNLFSPIIASEAATSLERSVYLTDGMFNCFHTNVQRLLPSLSESVSVVYDGITPLDSLYDPEDLFWRKLSGHTDAKHWLQAEVDCQKLDEFAIGSHTADLLNPAVKELFHQGRDFIAEFVEARQSHARAATDVVDWFWLEEFQSHFSAFGPQILRTTVEVRCPFFDQRMLDLIGTLTPLQRSSNKPLQRHTIHALTPELARFPWERTGLPLTASFSKIQWRRLLRALQRRMRAWRKQQPPPSPIKMIDYDEMLRTSPELRKKITATLLEGWAEGSRLFNRQSLQFLLDEHMSRTGNFAEMLGRIFTVETWYKLFVQPGAHRARIATQKPQRVYHIA